MKKSAFLFLSAVILFSCGTASTRDQNKTGCVKGDCGNGNGTYIFLSGDTYTGDFKNEKMNGAGTTKYTNGDIYTGHWKDDSREGLGILFYSDGDEYEGEFFDNVPYGKGKYTYADGSVEKGFFAEHLFTGQIRLPEAGDNEKVAVSKIVDVKPSDFEVTIADAGELKIGDRLFVEVNGTMCALKVVSSTVNVSRCKMIGGTRFLVFQVSKDLTVYKIMKGIKRGDNTFLFPNGNKYIGDYKGNLMNGKGEFTWRNGSKYTGEFKDGMRNGKGILITSGGAIYGAVYTGEFKNGYYDGFGRYETNDKKGYVYEGQWKKGVKTGTGKMTISATEHSNSYSIVLEG
ncbi:MAG TPA: hypothetical protein PLY36_10625, partial [Spirochaetota bacterium]|nr:hypothetical protein [Spirochaetota bacterium]